MEKFYEGYQKFWYATNTLSLRFLFSSKLAILNVAYEVYLELKSHGFLDSGHIILYCSKILSKKLQA